MHVCSATNTNIYCVWMCECMNACMYACMCVRHTSALFKLVVLTVFMFSIIDIDDMFLVASSAFLFRWCLCA